MQLVDEHSEGLLALAALLLVAGGFIHWMVWLSGRGRFRSRNDHVGVVQYLFSELFARIITEFRHMLALVIVVVFAVALVVATLPGLESGNIEDITSGLQAVAASLGGLLGSIIGYYFGESAAARKLALGPPPGVAGDDWQKEGEDEHVSPDDERDIREPELPEGLGGAGDGGQPA